MERRAFLKVLGLGAAAVGAAAAAPALFDLADLDRATWIPGARRYFDLFNGVALPEPPLEISQRFLQQF